MNNEKEVTKPKDSIVDIKSPLDLQIEKKEDLTKPKDIDHHSIEAKKHLETIKKTKLSDRTAEWVSKYISGISK